MRRATILAALLAGASASFVGCILSESDCTFDGTCGAASGSLPDGGDSPDVGLDFCIETPMASNCLDETKAFFVSSLNGDDGGGDGSRGKPLKTLTAALARVDSNRKRVYVCEGKYAEDVVMTAAHSGVSIIGGIGCNWAPAPAARPVIGATATPFAINGSKGVALVDVAIEAGSSSSGTSIGLFLVEAEVSLVRARVVSGDVPPTAPSGTLEPYSHPPRSSLNGFDAPSETLGGGERLVTCPGGGQTKGGKGGNPGKQGDPGTVGPDNRGAIGGCGANPSGTGGDGLPGSSGKSGTGARKFGELLATGWKPAGGERGADGTPGQGGGGGYGTDGSGGGGGAGGCGGAGGAGGSGGSSSITIAALSTKLNVDRCEFVAKAAGGGGAGVGGQAGQNEVGSGGTRSNNACNGGPGGKGGDGGGGGGGAGGLSVNVLFRSSTVYLDDATKGVATTGAKGLGGKGVPASDDENNGMDGVAELMLELTN